MCVECVGKPFILTAKHVVDDMNILDIRYRTHILCVQQEVVKMKKSDRAAVTALAFVFVGLWLLSNPNCDTGCQTVAEHLVKHGITGLFG